MSELEMVNPAAEEAPRTRKPATMQQGHADDFQTPPEALEPLWPYLRPEWTIWEPAAGRGNLALALAGRGHEVIASDVQSGGEPTFYAPGLHVWWENERDFLHWNPVNASSGEPLYDCIITNPPFTIKDEFLVRCYELGKPFALLLPFTSFEGRLRQALFRQHGVEVIFLPSRVKFTTPSGKVGGSWFPVAWFTHGLGIGRELTFWTPEQQDALPLEVAA